MSDPISAPLMASAIVLVAGYLLGSIPFGLILTRLAGGPDIRSIGSGNIGATNVLRTGRRGLAAATLLLDMIKGTVAVVLARSVFGGNVALLAGLGAFLGHLFPVWLKFKGGKGVATYIGVLAGLVWPLALIFCAIWLAIAAATRYSSLSALVASAAIPLLAWGLDTPQSALLLGLMSVLLWIKHRANIARLLRGEEGKIGKTSPAEPGL